MPQEFSKWQLSLQKEEWQYEVEKAYGLPNSLWSQHEGIYRIENTTGSFALKEITFPLDEFRYIALAMEHLATNGFEKLNRIISTRKGDFSVNAKNKNYFLSPWINGRIADYHEESDVAIAALSLAKIHIASTGYIPPYYKGRTKWGELLPSLKHKITEMEEWGELGEKMADPTYMDLLYRKYCKINIETANEAVGMLSPVYSKVNARESQRSCFCHHDFAHHNILIDYQGEAWVIDFDYCISDTNCHDLASLLIRVLKANDWDTGLAMIAWRNYNAVRPLSEEEKQVVESLMYFPQDFWQVGFSHYVEGYHSLERLERKLFLWLVTREKREKALEEMSELFNDYRFECACHKADYEKDE